MSTTDGRDDLTSAATKEDHDTDRSAAGTNEEHSKLATHPDPTVKKAPDKPAPDKKSRVEWVRPVDLAARVGADAITAAKDADQSLAAAIKEEAGKQRRRLAQKLATRGAEVSVDRAGHSAARSAAREGVSR